MIKLILILLFFIIILTIFILYCSGYLNTFNYNDKISYFNTNFNNSEYLFNIVDKYGEVKDSNKNFNTSSCKLFKNKLFKKYLPDYYNYYTSSDFVDSIKNIIGEPNLYISNNDDFSVVIQIYKNNDFMQYHFDTNYTLGTRYTVLIPVFINEYNDSYLNIKTLDNLEKKIIIPIGQGIVYNGDKVYHKVSKQSMDGKRAVIIINLTTNNNQSLLGKFLGKFRNYLFNKYTI